MVDFLQLSIHENSIACPVQNSDDGTNPNNGKRHKNVCQLFGEIDTQLSEILFDEYPEEGCWLSMIKKIKACFNRFCFVYSNQKRNLIGEIMRMEHSQKCLQIVAENNQIDVREVARNPDAFAKFAQGLINQQKITQISEE